MKTTDAPAAGAAPSTAALARMYVIAGTVLAFFILWSLVAARPFPTAREAKAQTVIERRDPRLVQLEQRERNFNARAQQERQKLDRRWAAYKVAQARRVRQIAAVRRANAATLAAARTQSGGSGGGYSSAYSGGGLGGYSGGGSSVPQVRVVTTPSPPPVTSTHSS
jgi:uncharacterized membrane protein YgcG